jgi:hypothetical protein
MRSPRRAHYRDWISFPGAVAKRARCPVDRTLQDAGDGVVVLECDEEYGVGRADAGLEERHPFRRVCLFALIKGRDAVESLGDIILAGGAGDADFSRAASLLLEWRDRVGNSAKAHFMAGIEKGKVQER